MPPYYTMLRLPGHEDLQFVLLRPFVPFSDQDQRKELQAIMTASSDPANYGQLRVLVIDQSPLPEGPRSSTRTSSRPSPRTSRCSTSGDPGSPSATCSCCRSATR